MSEQILDILKKCNKALSADELFDLLNLNDVNDFKILLKTLNQMEDDLLLYRTNKNNFMLFNNSHLKIGIMMATKKGYGFVDIEGPDDVFVPERNMNNAIHGDKVVVEITSKKGVSLEGRIVRIIERKIKQMVGEIVFQKDVPTVVLDDEKIKLNIVLENTEKWKLVDGYKVLIKIKEKLKDNTYKAEIVEILGHKNDPGTDILSIVRKYEIQDKFSEEVKEELKSIPDKVSEKEIIDRINNGGRDLRNQIIFTIDGADTKDIDDAISIRKLENDEYELGVHIADVSYYVKEGSALYNEAMDRGTSVYLADRVIPMLPHQLSNGICSLNPNEDRFAISCVMKIDRNGNVLSSELFESIICSKMKMTYGDVNKVLDGSEIPEGYEKFKDDLLMMNELSDKLRQNMVSKGYIDFDIKESKIIVDESGKAIDIKLRERGAGENMIENFMIAANESVASTIYYMELPFIYRVHGKPSEEKMDKFLSFVSGLGYSIKGDTKDLTPIGMQHILKQLVDKKEYQVLSFLLLRSMRKAVYDTQNIGHFGLGSNNYTHFTSPIRRFPDTTVHRLIRKYLFKGQINNEVINSENQKLPYIAEHSSKKERDSADCEREVDDMKKAEYMMSHIGESYNGIISGITSFGVFVQLPNMIEGLIKIDELDDDYYIFDESTISLIGKRTKKSYRLGDDIKVIVKSASKEMHTVDFVIENEKNIKFYKNIEHQNDLR